MRQGWRRCSSTPRTFRASAWGWCCAAAIIERGMVRAGRLVRLKVSARIVPGSLAAITATVTRAGANINEVHHQRPAPRWRRKTWRLSWCCKRVARRTSARYWPRCKPLA